MSHLRAIRHSILATCAFLMTHSGASAAPAAPIVPTPRLLKAPIERSVMELPVVAARADRTATAATAPKRPRLDGNDTIPPADDHLIFSNRFQELNGDCNDRDWLQEDRTTRVFGHVDTRFVTNSAFYAAQVASPGQIQFSVPLDTNPIHASGVLAVENPNRVVWIDGAQGSDAFTFDHVANQTSLRALGQAFTIAQAAVVMPSGSLIVADDNHLYQFTTPSTPPVVIAGNPSGSLNDTTAASARLSLNETQLQVDAAGNLWFSEGTQGRIRMLRANDNRIVTMVGTGGVLNGESLFRPNGFAFDIPGNLLYVLDRSGFAIYRYDLATQARALFAGGGGDNIPAFQKAAVVSGELFASALGDGKLYRLHPGTLPGEILEIVVGAAEYFGAPAGRNDADRFAASYIEDIVADGTGGILFTSNKAMVLRFDTATGQLSLAGGVPVPIDMGARAFWIGADMTSAPDEVSSWVVDRGYGNSWGQWLESPSISLGGSTDVVLTFDLAMDMAETFANEYVDVLVQDATGVWQGAKFQVEAAAPQSPAFANFFGSLRYAMGRGLAKVEVRLNSSENAGLNLGANTRFRVYLRTNAFNSSEDGFDFFANAGGAIFDNLRVTNLGLDLIPPADFEDGGTRGWTPGARNFAFDGNNNFTYAEMPAAGTGISLRDNHDAANSSCVWTFLSPGDSVGPGVLARITSPWIRRFSPSTDLLINFSGKLPTISQSRFMTIGVRGKNIGDMRPRFVSPGLFIYNSGSVGDDAASAYVNRRQLQSQLDLQFAPDADSVQLVFEIQERERGLTALPYSRLPFLDEIEVMELGADSDYDGIADAVDACPSVCAAGQDADGDGCPDPTSTMRHVESWSSGLPSISFTPSATGLPGVNDGSDLLAVRAAAAAWRDVPGAINRLTEVLPTPQTASSALDGVNLVTFQDPNLEFPPSVLAVTPTLSFDHTMNYGDRVVPQGEIVDADVIVNGAASLSTPTHPGQFDLQGVMTHEFGHLLGLTHSGVKDATMYFVQLPAQDARSLELDDHAALAAAYPAATLGPNFSSIQGVVLRDTTGGGLPGALVTAVRLDAGGAPEDTVASDYTDENGTYKIFRLPPGDYGVHIQALDGSALDGLSPGFISQRLALIADTSFDPEWFTTGDSFSDDPTVKTVITLANGDDYLGADIVSNLDTTAPSVTSINPADGTLDVGVDATVLVNFSEPISVPSLQSAFGLRVQGDSTRLAGNGILSGFGRTFVFTPASALRFNTAYELTVSTALADGNGVHPVADFVSTFRTQLQPPVSIADIQPRFVLPGGIITVTGAGFDAETPSNNLVAFSNGDSAAAGFVTPTSFVTTVPLAAPASLLSVIAIRSPGADSSNSFDINLVSPAPQASPIPNGAAVGVPFVPRDVALSSDGTMVYVVGDGGFATINLDAARAAAQPAQHPLRAAVSRLVGQHGRIVLSTDGQRAYISVPDAQALLEVEAVPASAAFGSVRDSIPVQGDPFGLAAAPTGKRLWYTDNSSLRIGEVNVDQASAGKNEVVRTFDTSYQPNGGLTVDDGSQELHYTGGIASGRIFLTNGTQAAQSTGFARGVVLDHYGRNAYYAGGLSGLRRVGLLNFIPTLIATGGSVADLSRSPIGPSMFVVNDGTNRLLVVNADSTDLTYGGLMAEVATGSSPAAVTVNANGGTIAVANAGDATISLYSYGATSTPTALRVVPSAAIPGEAVAVHGAPATSGFTAGTLVDLAAGSPFVAQNAQGEAAGFNVPDVSARSTSVTLARPDGQRTLGLPFQIVEPLSTFAPRSAALTITPPSLPCFSPVRGRLTQARLSPDGRRLVILSETTCNVFGQVFTVADDDIAPATSRLLLGIPISGFESVDNSAITPDGRFLWIASGQLGARIFDIEPSSPTAGAIVGTVGVTPLGNPRVILADPLGRFMICGTHNGSGPGSDGISLWPTNGVDALITSIPGTTAWSMAASGDGRYLVAGEDNRAHIIDLNSRTLITTTASRGQAGARYISVAVSRDGKRATGLLLEPVTILPTSITMWNLDPAAGAVGAEIYHGQVPGTSGQTFGDIYPAPDGTGFYLPHAMDPFLVYLMVRDTGFSSGLTALPFVPSSLVLSQDGRRMWAVRNGSGGRASTDADIQMFDASRATALSVVSGNGQSGLASAVLPVPVRVRVTHDGGRPEPGVMVRFATAGVGAGTIVPGELISVTRITDSNGEAEVFWRMPASTPT
ncbi:MAG: Ig-like domain-containing protein, partial [Candidatus Eisenbacteria bacterium]